MNLIERFKNYGLAVHCDTEEKAKKFIEWCYENGMEWQLESSKPFALTHYASYHNKTTYSLGGDNYLKFGTASWYKEHGYKVVTYDDFMKGVDGMKEFTLNDLEAGKHVIETRKGDRYLVCTAQEQLVGVGSDGWISLGFFKQNMQCCGTSDFDIAKVYEIKYACHFSRMLANDNDNLTLVWEREEVKELTMADIEKLVGCKVKIVKEEC